MNKMIMNGILVNEPEFRIGRSKDNNEDIFCADFVIKVKRKKKKINNKPEYDYFFCTTFGQNAVHANKYFVPGMNLLLHGHMRSDIVTIPDSTDHRFFVHFLVDEQEFTGGKRKEEVKEAKIVEAKSGSEAWQDAYLSYVENTVKNLLGE